MSSGVACEPQEVGQQGEAVVAGDAFRVELDAMHGDGAMGEGLDRAVAAVRSGAEGWRKVGSDRGSELLIGGPGRCRCTVRRLCTMQLQAEAGFAGQRDFGAGVCRGRKVPFPRDLCEINH